MKVDFFLSFKEFVLLWKPRIQCWFSLHWYIQGYSSEFHEVTEDVHQCNKDKSCCHKVEYAFKRADSALRYTAVNQECILQMYPDLHQCNWNINFTQWINLKVGCSLVCWQACQAPEQGVGAVPCSLKGQGWGHAACLKYATSPLLLLPSSPHRHLEHTAWCSSSDLKTLGLRYHHSYGSSGGGWESQAFLNHLSPQQLCPFLASLCPIPVSLSVGLGVVKQKGSICNLARSNSPLCYNHATRHSTVFNCIAQTKVKEELAWYFFYHLFLKQCDFLLFSYRKIINRMPSPLLLLVPILAK